MLANVLFRALTWNLSYEDRNNAVWRVRLLNSWGQFGAQDETLSVKIADACKADGTTAAFWEKKNSAASTKGIFYRESLKSCIDA